MIIWVQPLFSAMDFLSISKYQHSITSDCFPLRSFASGRPRSGLAPSGGEGGVCAARALCARSVLVRWSQLRGEVAQTLACPAFALEPPKETNSLQKPWLIHKMPTCRT